MPNPFVHIELTTGDLKKAAKFYSKIFAWKVSPMPGMQYMMIDVGGGTGGGMQATPMPGAPTAWLPYVQVDSVKATIVAAKKAGAKIELDYREISGGMGAIGVFTDPTGAMIGVWEAKSAAPTTKKSPAKKSPAKKSPAKKSPAKKKR
jgi:predicted enzyme related to lactoylglutathione lyase